LTSGKASREKRQRVLAVLPLLLLAGSVALVAHRGPYYLGMHADPEYAYLFNALNILTLNAPFHVDHPGTTLQVLSAVVVFVQWLVRCVVFGWEHPQYSVIGHPEAYLRVINFVLNVWLCGLLFTVARSLLRRTGSLFPPLVFQFACLAYLEFFIAQARVTPEPMLVIAALLFSWALLPAVLPLPEEYETSRRTAALAGAAFAFGVVTKVVFLPLVALVLVLRGWRLKLWFVTAAAAAGLVFLLPIVTELGRVTGWLWRVLTHAGRYGGGEVGLAPPGHYIEGVWRLGRDEPALYLFSAFCGAVLLMLLVWWRVETDERTQALRRLLAGTLLATAVLVALSAKQYGARYVLPAMCLTPLALSLIATWVLRQDRAATQRRAVVAAGVAVAVLAGGLSGIHLLDWLRQNTEYRRQVARVEAVIDSQGDCLVIRVDRSSDPEYALHHGNGFSSGRHYPVLEEMYPESFVYNPLFRRFETFVSESRDADIRRIVDSGRCVLVRGHMDNIEMIQGYRIEPLHTWSEAVVRLR
jgi:Zn-dependent membrane protease YugP